MAGAARETCLRLGGLGGVVGAGGLFRVGFFRFPGDPLVCLFLLRGGFSVARSFSAKAAADCLGKGTSAGNVGLGWLQSVMRTRLSWEGSSPLSPRTAFWAGNEPPSAAGVSFAVAEGGGDVSETALRKLIVMMRSPASCAVDEAGEILISLRQRSLFLTGVALKIRNVLPPTRKMGLSERKISSYLFGWGWGWGKWKLGTYRKRLQCV